MIFVVAESDGQRRPSKHLLLQGRIEVGPEEGHRGRVVVQFVQAEAELLDDVCGHAQDQRRHIGSKQLVQRPPYTVVVEQADFLLGQVQQIGSVADRPLTKTVNRFPGNEQIAKQDQQGLCWGELRAAVLRRECVSEELFQAYSAEQFIHHGQCTNGGRTQKRTTGSRHRRRGRWYRRRPRSCQSGTLGRHGLGLLSWEASTRRSAFSVTPRGQRISITGGSSPKENVHRSPKSRGTDT